MKFVYFYFDFDLNGFLKNLSKFMINSKLKIKPDLNLNGFRFKIVLSWLISTQSQYHNIMVIFSNVTINVREQNILT